MSLIAWLRNLFNRRTTDMAETSGRIPASIDLNLYAGDSEIFGLTLTDAHGDAVDTLSGQWAAQIKPEGVTEPIEAFTITLDTATPGRMEMAIDAGASQRLGIYTQKLRWDLQQSLPDSVTVITHAQGNLVMTDDVTRVAL